jgi:hypothetical protein
MQGSVVMSEGRGGSLTRKKTVDWGVRGWFPVDRGQEWLRFWF